MKKLLIAAAAAATMGFASTSFAAEQNTSSMSIQTALVGDQSEFSVKEECRRRGGRGGGHRGMPRRIWRF